MRQIGGYRVQQPSIVTIFSCIPIVFIKSISALKSSISSFEAFSVETFHKQIFHKLILNEAGGKENGKSVIENGIIDDIFSKTNENRPFSNFKLPLTTTTTYSISKVLVSIWS